MANFETVFAKEFTQMMNQRRAQNTGFSIKDIPCPDLKLIDAKDFVTGGKLAYIKDIQEPFFSDLNESTAEIVKGRTFKKRVSYYDETGKVKFREDKNGGIMQIDVPVSSGFVAIYSSVNIHLPNKLEKNGEKRIYRPKDGYKFVDYVDTEKGRKYLYLVPIENVYPLELCALVISLNKHRAYYKGCRVALTNGHYVYVYSIPYKYRENSGYYLIGAKPNPNFDEEMKILLDYWMKHDILFDLNMTALDSQYKGAVNMGIEDYPGTCMPEDYVKITNSLKKADLEEL